jgi:hypothetical protein
MGDNKVAIEVTGKNSSKQTFEDIKKDSKGLGDIIKQSFKDAASAATNTFKGMGSSIKESFISAGTTFGKVASGIKSVARDMGSYIKENWKQISISAGLAAIGLERLIRRVADQGEALDKLSFSLNMSSQELRNLAVETTNAGFSVEEVIGLFKEAQKQGADTGVELKKFANFWDMVGDATGDNSLALAEASVGLRAMKIELNNLNTTLPAFGYMQTKTTIGTMGFLQIIERLAPNLIKMKLGLNETAAIFGFLESKGLVGRKAISAFDQAVGKSKGNQKEFFKLLGMTKDDMDKYNAAVLASGSVIEQMAAANDAHITSMQKVNAEYEKMLLKHGMTIESFNIIVPILGVVATAVGSLATVIPLATGVFGSLGTAMGVTAGIAALTVGSVLLAVGAWGWAIYEIIKYSGDINYNVDLLADYLSDKMMEIKDAIAKNLGDIKFHYNMAVSDTADWIESVVSAYRDIPYNIRLIWDTVKSYWGDLKSYVINAASGIYQGIQTWMVDRFNQAAQKIYTIINGIRAAWQALKGILVTNSIIPDMVDEILSHFGRMNVGIMKETNEATKGITKAFQISGMPTGMENPEAIAGMVSKQTGPAPTRKDDIKRQQEDAKQLAIQREYDNMTMLQQLQVEKEKELALARKYGQETKDIEAYWNEKINDERMRQAEDQKAKEEKVHQENLEMIKKFEDAKLAIQKKAKENEAKIWDQRAAIATQFSSTLKALNDVTAERNQTLVAAIKLAGIAEATINTYVAATKALAELGPIAGPIMAGAIVTQGLAMVAAITETKLAEGGIITRPTRALVGEAGPEAVIPLSRMGRLGGGDHFNVSLTGPFMGTIREANRWARKMYDAEKRLRQRYGEL